MPHEKNNSRIRTKAEAMMGIRAKLIKDKDCFLVNNRIVKKKKKELNNLYAEKKRRKKNSFCRREK